MIGAWFNGEFVPVPSPHRIIDENTILLVAGRRDNLLELQSRTISPRIERPNHVLISGYGMVGRYVAETLSIADTPFTVVDLVDKDGVDITGDIMDEDTLTTAQVSDSRAVILAMDDDTKTCSLHSC